MCACLHYVTVLWVIFIGSSAYKALHLAVPVASDASREMLLGRSRHAWISQLEEDEASQKLASPQIIYGL